jgi:AcrR family transcriptional regulator
MPTAPVTLSATAQPRRKGEITAERILDAAEEIFSERGYAGTTLRDVAERVGLRIPSLYNHFASKDSLYAAVLERGIGPVLGILSEFTEEGQDTYRDSALVMKRIMALLARRPKPAAADPARDALRWTAPDAHAPRVDHPDLRAGP